LTLYVWRAPMLRSAAGFDLVSRESFLLFNNILLVIATAVVFGGTMAPFISELAGHGTISVGAPYYNSMFLLPILPLVALVSIGTFARWKRGALGESHRRILMSLALAVVLGLALILGIYGDRSLLGPIGVVLGAWVVISALVDPIDRLRRGLSLSAAVIGMTVAHIGLGVITLGITTMERTMLSRDVALAPGKQVELGQYGFRLEGIEDVRGPNYEASRARVVVTHKGQPEAVMFPEQRRYMVQQQSLAEAKLDVALSRDLLATLKEPLGEGAWAFKFNVRPLMQFVWIGAALMALGGLLATLDRRYRRRRDAADAGGQA
jgi:cytochrome c-type biogenesis protein CcmF